MIPKTLTEEEHEEIRKEFESESGKKWMINPTSHGETGFASWDYQLWLESSLRASQEEVKRLKDRELELGMCAEGAERETTFVRDNLARELAVLRSELEEYKEAHPDFSFEDLEVTGPHSGCTGIVNNHPEPGAKSVNLRHKPSGKTGYVRLNA